MIKRLLSKLSMKKHSVLFVDQVNRKEVYLYIDRYGEQWMAQSKFGFRVKRIN